MRNVKIDEFDRLDRDVVALGNGYAQGFILPRTSIVAHSYCMARPD